MVYSTFMAAVFGMLFAYLTIGLTQISEFRDKRLLIIKKEQ